MKSIKLLGVIFIIMVSVMGCEKKKRDFKNDRRGNIMGKTIN